MGCGQEPVFTHGKIPPRASRGAWVGPRMALSEGIECRRAACKGGDPAMAVSNPLAGHGDYNSISLDS